MAGALLLMAMTLQLQQIAAQFVHTSHDARSGAMGGVVLLDTARRIELGYRQDFMMAGMADKRVAAVVPIGGIGVAMVEYNHHGNDAYHEQTAAAGYMLRVAEWLRVGVAGRWFGMGVGDAWYEPRHWLGANVAVVVSPTHKADVYVVAGTRPWDDVKPWKAVAQVLFRPSQAWTTVVTVESDDRWRVRYGMEYAYEGPLFFRAGVATNPMLLDFGVGVRHGLLALDIGAEVHSALGLSPCCSMRICF